MVSRDIRMKLTPDLLDRIIRLAIRRQIMHHHASIELRQRPARLSTLMNDVVIDDKMNYL